MAPPSTRTRAKEEDSSNEDFQRFVRAALLDIKDKQLPSMQEKLVGLENSLVFEAERITEVEKKADTTQKKVHEMERTLAKHDELLEKMAAAENKLERFSRKNNIRIVGMKEKTGEKPLELVAKMLSERFDLVDPQLERAHRDGKKGDRPRHMLVKLLRYQDKRTILKQQRKQLEDCDFFVTDDLTKVDLTQKKLHKAEVSFLFERGVKLFFSAGKWRDKNGNLAPFYNANNPVAK